MTLAKAVFFKTQSVIGTINVENYIKIIFGKKVIFCLVKSRILGTLKHIFYQFVGYWINCSVWTFWIKSNLYSFEANKNYKWCSTLNFDKFRAVPRISNKHFIRSVFGKRTFIFSTLTFTKLFISIISMLLTWLNLLIAVNSL